MNSTKNIITRMNIIFIILCILLLILTGCKSKHVNNENEEIGAKVDEYINAFNKVCTKNKYIGNILISKGDKIVFQKSYGSEYIEEDSIPLQDDTVFRIGSISKTFTAVAILQLQEKGLLNIDDPISKYIPLKENNNKITIRSILNHTSGLVRDGYFDITKKYSSQDELSLSQANKPFTKWMYSNYGYRILAYIIEVVSGTSYETFLNENIFIPANMNSTGCENANTDIPKLAPPLLYSQEIKLGVNKNMCHYIGSGNIYSTTSDLFKFINALENEKILKSDSLNLMTCDSTGLSANYGLGMELGDFKGHKFYGHSGAIVYGYRSMLMRFPNDDVTVILLLNVYLENIVDMVFPLASIVMDEEYYLPVNGNEILMSEEELKLYEGEYKTLDNIIVTIKSVGNNHLEVTPSGIKTVLVPYSKTDFAVKNMEHYKIEFIFDSNNQIVGLKGYTNVDKIEEAEKIN